MKKVSVAIVMGSESDLDVMKMATVTLRQFGISSQTKIISAHRTPEQMLKFAKTAEQKFKVIIAGAGGAAHLPGMIASLTTLPVIGVPVAVTKLNGLDALLSVVQMPKGVPVATVAIDNAVNAALLAARIIGIHDKKVAKLLRKFQNEQKISVKKMNRDLKSKKRI